MKTKTCQFVLLLISLLGCSEKEHHSANLGETNPRVTPPSEQASNRPVNKIKVVHVFVPLCDNSNQGIVPVPAKLGNGQDPYNNLYWGAMYGVKTFFSKSTWKTIKGSKPQDGCILDRALFVDRIHKPQVLVVADAYDGAHMKRALDDFIKAAAGLSSEIVLTLEKETMKILVSGGSDLVCFVGHNGLMDMDIEMPANHSNSAQRSAVVLACKSHPYFVPYLRKINCTPLVTTSGLMAPEAYALDAVIKSWFAGDPANTIRENAATAYAKYQKCGLHAARKLFIAGW